jgi:hypothetical protein
LSVTTTHHTTSSPSKPTSKTRSSNSPVFFSIYHEPTNLPSTCSEGGEGVTSTLSLLQKKIFITMQSGIIPDPQNADADADAKTPAPPAGPIRPTMI